MSDPSGSYLGKKKRAYARIYRMLDLRLGHGIRRLCHCGAEGARCRVLGMFAAAGLAAAGLSGCAAPPVAGTSLVSIPGSPPSLEMIVAADPAGSAVFIDELVKKTGRSRETIDLYSGGGVQLDASSVANPAPMSVPDAPTLPDDPTTFQLDAYDTGVANHSKLVKTDKATLDSELAGEITGAGKALESAATTAKGNMGPGVTAGLDGVSTLLSGLEAADSVFSNRVIVLVGEGTAPPVGLSSLDDTTVIVADYPGGYAAAQAEQEALLQSDAGRAVVLDDAATAIALVRVVRQALSGETGPAPSVVRFGLNSSAITSQTRVTLDTVAALICSSYPTALVAVDGFADPIGFAQRNRTLSLARALAVASYVHQRCPKARISPEGFGTELPVAVTGPGGQPLDRRALIVIDALETG